MNRPSGLVHQLIRNAAERWPHRPAIRFRGGTTTYEQLARQASGLARWFVQHGIGTGDRVGILLAKRPEAIAAIYGILEAGAAYVPIDPLAPAALRAGMVEEYGLSAMVSSADRASELPPDLLHGLAVVVVGEIDPPHTVLDRSLALATYRDAASSRGSAALPVVGLDDAACIMPTSGSTRHPRAVMHGHRALAQTASWTIERFHLTPSDRLAMHPPLHFVLGAYGIFPAAAAGAVSVLVPEAVTMVGGSVVELIQREGVTLWASVPSALTALARSSLPAGSLRSLRTIMISGGPFPPADVPRLIALAPNASLANVYGSTEAWAVTEYLIDAEDAAGTIPAGRPVTGVAIELLDKQSRPVPAGQTGEVVVRSPRLMLGYWNDPDATERVLIRTVTGERAYRTGDMARLRPDGELELTGRIDDLVKIRGFRVNLSEVEAALGKVPGVTEAAAVAVSDEEEETGIVAVVAVDEDARWDEATTRVLLSERLPHYAIPRVIHVVGHLPRTKSGKLDRQSIARGVSRGTS